MVRDDSSTFVGRLFVNRLQAACVKIVVFTLPFRSFNFLFRFAKCLVQPFMRRLLFCHGLPPSCKVNLQVVLNASYTAFKCFCPKNLNAYMPLKTSEPSGTSQFICTRTFRNLTEHLHRNPPEPSGTLPGTWC